MAGWNTASIYMKIALVCTCLGLLLFVIGFATVSWANGQGRGIYGHYEHDYGLWKWKHCTGNGCNEGTKPDRSTGRSRDWRGE